MDNETIEVHGNRQLVDRDLFRDVIGHFTSGVTVLTTRHQGINFGLTASAVTSLSLEPPMLLVCINQKSGTCHAISNSKVFAVNILHENQGDLAMRFARPNTDKFKDLDIAYGQLGEPLLHDVLAYLECRVVEEVTGGTHSVLLAEVQNAHASSGTPLAYFRGKFGHFQEANDEMLLRRIRQKILTRQFSAGQVLGVTDLAYQLDAPRQGVYYALTRLHGEGLVVREEESSYRINSLDAKSLNEALDTRCALEIAAAERTVNKISPGELTELRQRMLETLIDESSDLSWVDRNIEANFAFHDFTVALANNHTLSHAYRQLTAEAVMSSALRAALQERDRLAREELNILTQDHVSLTEAFAAGDVEEVKLIIRRHTEGAKRLGKYLIDSAGGSI